MVGEDGLFVSLSEKSLKEKPRERFFWVRGMLGVRGEADLWRPWESWACFLSDIQDSWVGTLAESAPGGCTAGMSAKSFQSPAGYYIRFRNLYGKFCTQKALKIITHSIFKFIPAEQNTIWKTSQMILKKCLWILLHCAHN